MTRYFFDVMDSEGNTVDDTGEDFSTDDDVEAEIARIIADVARDRIGRQKRGQITVKVRDDTSRIVYAGSLLFAIKKLGDD